MTLPSPSLLSLLVGLGPDCDTVAATLLAAGRRGWPGNPVRCPVVAHLQAAGWTRVLVAPTFVGGWRGGQYHVEQLPAAVAEFVARYDVEPHKFPALLESFESLAAQPLNAVECT